MKHFVTVLVALALPLQPAEEIAVVRDGEIVLRRAWGKPPETLTLNTYAEPGAKSRWEQLMITP